VSSASCESEKHQKHPEPVATKMNNTPPTLPPPPRSVRSRDGAIGKWGLRIVLFPHTCVGIACFFYTLALMAWALFGSQVPGAITGGSPEIGSGRGHHGPTVLYKYDYNGPRAGSQDVGNNIYHEAVEEQLQKQRKHSAVQVRVLAIGPWQITGIDQFESPWVNVAEFSLFTAFWDTLCWIIFKMIWLEPIMSRLMCKYGTEAAGIITVKGPMSSRKGKLGYTFLDAAGVSRTGMLKYDSVNWMSEEMRTAEAGQRICVLYSARNPKRNLPYDLLPQVVKLP
jgi:hypothetical protein